MDNKKVKYLIKHNKQKNKNLEYDFMPGLVEIIEKPINKGGIIIIWTISLLIAFSLIWAYTCKVDVVDEMRGVIASSDSIASVNSRYSGIIAKVYIKDGDVVKNGDILLDIINDKGKLIHITSNNTGVAADLSDLAVGSQIEKTQEILKIVPNNNKYVVKVNIENKDIADIEKGDKVNIKIDAYAYGDYGMFEGKVVKINQYAEVTEQGNYCFPAEIKINKNNNRKIKFMDGMTCTTEVSIGKRRIIEYILEPIVEALRGSVKQK